MGVPAIVGVLGSDVRVSRGGTRRAVAKALRLADFVVGVSRELCRQAVHLGASPERIRAIPNGCNATIFQPADRAQIRLELGVEPNTELVLFVGRLVPIKGLHELLHAMCQLIRTRPRIELVCIGDGPLKKEIADRAERDLPDRVHLLGSQPPEVIARWLAASNLLCLPSHSEGCPNVVIEALSSGRPVVASNVGGVPELLDADSGVLVKPGSPESLRAGIELALQRSWNEQRLAANSKRSWDQVAEETIAVCRLVLARSETREDGLKLLC